MFSRAFYYNIFLYFYAITSTKKRWKQTRVFKHINISVCGDFTIEIFFNLSCVALVLSKLSFSTASWFIMASKKAYWQHIFRKSCQNRVSMSNIKTMGILVMKKRAWHWNLHGGMNHKVCFKAGHQLLLLGGLLLWASQNL